MRAAYGIFYDPYYNGEGGPLQAPESAPPWFKTIQESFPSSFADPLPAGSNPFAPNFAGGPQSLTLLTLDPHLQVPYAQDWNFTVEHTFGQGWLLEVGYVGTKGTKLPRFIESNPPTLCSTLPLSQQSSCISGEQQNVNAYPPLFRLRTVESQPLQLRVDWPDFRHHQLQLQLASDKPA